MHSLPLLPAVNAAALPGAEIKVDKKGAGGYCEYSSERGRETERERERQFRRQLSTREEHEEAWGRGGRRELRVKSHGPKTQKVMNAAMGDMAATALTRWKRADCAY